jgi:Putative addiction module component
MARALSDIEQDIRSLTEQDRARLLRLLISDLDAPADAGADAAWLVEAERRLAQDEDGSALTYPLDEVLEEARSRLK